ncbi:MAG: tRNA 2-thiocytidine biosynthesis TtcA family protein [Clostridiales bacterium]|nr:tRNA 2-thiocytidine biosynthesis TtcA family protein [Clostridiales bacterium]
MDQLNEFSGLLRRAIDDYGMIGAGDRIAVGVSGGKDSLLLLAGLAHLKSYYPKPFELAAITVDPGFPDMDFSPVAELCRRLGVPYLCLKTDIREIVFDVRKEENPCSLCAKMRRGALNDALRERGMNKLALGHHFDDAVETFLLSLLFEGRIHCFRPVTYMSRSDVWQIRPMIYAGEKKIQNLVRALNLPVVTSTCPVDRTSKRSEVKALLTTLSARYPDLKSKIFGAMQRLPVDGWAPNQPAR